MSDTFRELTEQEQADADFAIRVAETLNEVVEVFGPDAIGWIRAELEKQQPVVHATSRRQRLLGRVGIRTRAWCGARIVAGRPSGATRECRECRRAVDGER